MLQLAARKQTSAPPATVGPAPIKEQVIHFVNKKMPGNLPKKTARALLDIEDRDYVPIIRNPQATTAETEAVFYFPGCGSERLFSQVGLATQAMLWHAGVQTVIALAAVYAQEVMGFSMSQTITLILVVNITAAVGAWAFGFFQDRVGHRRSLTAALIFWLVMVVVAWQATTPLLFWVAAHFAGLAMGASQSGARAAVAFAAALGTGLWLCALNVKYRDFRYVVPFIVQFGLYVSPVGFSSDKVPPYLRWLYDLNPMVGVIDGFRWACLKGVAPLDLRSQFCSRV